jgi:hypothetical protein
MVLPRVGSRIQGNTTTNARRESSSDTQKGNGNVDMGEPMAPIAWVKSRRCESGTCVEVASVSGAILMRDSKNPGGPMLRFSTPGWSAFVAGLRAGDFESKAG